MNRPIVLTLVAIPSLAFVLYLLHEFGYSDGVYIDYWSEKSVFVDADGLEVKEPKEGVNYQLVKRKKKRIEAEVRLRLFNNVKYIGKYTEWREDGAVRIVQEFSRSGERVREVTPGETP